jgi:predicted ATPase
MTQSVADDGTAAPAGSAVPFITRVRLRNYKSIASCDVRLGPLTILVGPNGSGKSNFLDALAFLARALETTPEEAINERGGLGEILRRVPDHAESFSIEIEAGVPWWPHAPSAIATYELEIAPDRHGTGFVVIREQSRMEEKGRVSNFLVSDGQGTIEATGLTGPVSVPRDRLFLQTAGSYTPFVQLYAGLSRGRFYNFNIEKLRRPQPSSARPLLRPDGEALGDVLAALAKENSPGKSRIDEYINAVVQDATSVDSHRVGGYVTLVLKVDIDGREFEFNSLSMSDGTMRVAAVLTALFQPEALDGRLPLVGIEEPELALHPSAAGILFGALEEASDHVQVIVTSHSADLLDRDDLNVSVIRAVTMRNGLTAIGEVDDASREIVERKLFTLGELMRGNQITPAPLDDESSQA